jgi:hypothetical protein
MKIALKTLNLFVCLFVCLRVFHVRIILIIGMLGAKINKKIKYGTSNINFMNFFQIYLIN